MKIQKILARIFVVMAIFSISVSASGGFDDVSSSHWAYGTISDAVEAGLFVGTSDTSFSPDRTMTRAEFITVIVRALAPDMVDTSTAGAWWQCYYDVALELGILQADELGGGDLEASMSRQEMALVLARSLGYSGEALAENLPISSIPDYGSVDSAYSSSVVVAYSNGLVGGVDAKGTYNPTGIMTRAEAATVLMRLVNPELRLEPAAAVAESLDDYLGDWVMTEYNVDVTISKVDGAYYLSAITVDSFGRIRDADVTLTVDEANQSASGTYDTNSWNNKGTVDLTYGDGDLVLTIQVTEYGVSGMGGLNFVEKTCTPADEVLRVFLKYAPDQIAEEAFYLDLIEENQYGQYMAYLSNAETITEWCNWEAGAWAGTGDMQWIDYTAETLNGRPYGVELFGYTQVQCSSSLIYCRYLDGDGEYFILHFRSTEWDSSLIYYEVPRRWCWTFEKTDAVG